MPLDPRAQRLLHMLEVSADAGRTQNAGDRRRSLANLTATVGGEAPEVGSVEMLSAPSPDGAISLRLYTPKAVEAGAIVFLHGGGWVAGDLETHDGVCRRLANATSRPVFAVDYRLAPEHPFPAALSDTLTAITWVRDQAEVLGVDRKKLVIAGDSAGGDLAAAACFLLRDQGEDALALQLLICPILDLATESASRREFAEGYFLSQATMARDLADYASGQDLFDPRLSPLHAKDLSGLPPTHIHVAEYDPFRDEGLAFARRLEDAGVPVSKTLHSGMIHYFYAMAGALPYAERAFEAIGAAVKAALAD